MKKKYVIFMFKHHLVSMLMTFFHNLFITFKDDATNEHWLIQWCSKDSGLMIRNANMTTLKTG
jgi:hypothetical protein